MEHHQQTSQRESSTPVSQRVKAPRLTHQKNTITEEEAEEVHDVVLPLTQRRYVTRATSTDSEEALLIHNPQLTAVPEDTPILSSNELRVPEDTPISRSNDLRVVKQPSISISREPSRSSSNMEHELLLVDSDGSYYCDSSCGTGVGGNSNGAIQMNILGGSDDTVNYSSDNNRLIQQHSSPLSCTLDSTVYNSTLINPSSALTTGSVLPHHQQQHNKSAATLYCTQPPYNSHQPPLHQRQIISSSPPSSVRNRHRFANLRSVSTDVPSRRDLHNCDVPLSKLSSHSGPLLRVNSFERGTQTKNKPAVVFNKLLDTEHRSHARYESAISDIGVEYMKATGVLGIKFKQLQKPSVPSHESVALQSPSKHYEPTADEEKGDKSATAAAGTTLPQAVPMNKLSNAISNHHNQSHVVKVNDEDDEPDETSPSTPDHNHIGYRLGRRKFLAERRRKIADLCCLFALIGLLLMVIETECDIAKVYTKDSPISYVMKSLISATTLVLLALITVYHAVEVQLFVVDNCIEDWRIAMSWQRVLQIATELILCAIHPVPIPFTFRWTILNIKTLQYQTADVPIDIIFSLPMFTRLYLIVRVMLLHSKLFTDASSRSIGALNKITFNTRFVLKTLMTIFPGTVMGVFMLSLWIICAWMFRACESYHDPLFSNFLNTLYMVAITFLSVGYGDYVPHTHCGRAISVISGLMGAGCTALVVAVIARKLELTRAEKHVHNFMLESQLSKKLKDAAANVLRETWLIYKYTKLVKRVNGRKVRSHQRKFLQAIQSLRLVKLKQRKLADQANSLTDFAKTTSQVHDIVADMRGVQEQTSNRVEVIEQTLNNLQLQLEALPHALAQAMIEKQLSTSSFVSANDMSLNNSPRQDPRRRLRPGMLGASQQSSFDSYG